MAPRLFVKDTVLTPGQLVSLEEGPARHVQVLRLQPGDALCLFDGRGGEWTARVTQMGRREVSVTVVAFCEADRELAWQVTLAVGMPANDRMDALVEKATELGVHAIQPLVCGRSVLRLDGERAAKKVAHWQSVAVSASEQSGRTRVPRIETVMPLRAWLDQSADGLATAERAVLSFNPERLVSDWVGRREDPPHPKARRLCFLSGPEGGLQDDEEAMAVAKGWQRVGLGPRVLRADTAPLMALSWVAGLLA